MKKVLACLLSVCLMLCTTLSYNNVKAETKDKINFTVVFKSEKLPADAENIIQELGGEIVYSVPEIGVIEVKGPSNFAKIALKNGNIIAATPSMEYQLPKEKQIELDAAKINLQTAKYWDYQWDIKRMTNNGESYNLNKGNHDVVVGILDTGIDLNHPDVNVNLVEGSKNFVAPGGVYGVDKSETGDINDVQDRNGHGTHCAGSIAGNGKMMGIAPNIGIRSYRIFGAEGGAKSAWILKAMIAAADDGVDVISMSLGGIYTKAMVYQIDPVTGEKTKLGSDIADYVAYTRAAKYANSKGVLIVASAGNDATNGSNKKEVTEFFNQKYAEYGYYAVGASVFAPASIPNVVTVSATGPNDELALYSNYGSGFIDVTAPGGDERLYDQYAAEGKLDEYMAKQLYVQEFCFSTVPIVQYDTDENGNVVGYTYVRPGYSWYIGTSMAAPKVSATAALIIAKYGKLGPNRVRVLLQQSADDIGKKGKDPYFGQGLVNAYNAMKK